MRRCFCASLVRAIQGLRRTLFTLFTCRLERRGETPTGGAAQGRGGAAEAGKGSERPRGQGDGPEGQTGEREGQSNR